MKTQEKIIKFLIFVLILIISLQTSVFASTLTLNVTTDKDSYKANDTISVTVDWKEKMQAASFKIGYDSDKLQFLSASIDETFYNKQTAGEISVNWASFDGKELTQIKFQFKALKDGKANVGIKDTPSFSDGNLVSPTNYDTSTSGTTNIKIEANSNEEQTEKPVSQNNQVTSENQVPKASKEDNSKAQSDIPKAGIQGNIVPTVFVIGILSIVFFIKNKKYSGL